MEKKALFSAKESIALLESSSYAFRALQILLGGQFYKNFCVPDGFALSLARNLNWMWYEKTAFRNGSNFVCFSFGSAELGYQCFT